MKQGLRKKTSYLWWIFKTKIIFSINVLKQININNIRMVCNSIFYIFIVNSLCWLLFFRVRSSYRRCCFKLIKSPSLNDYIRITMPVYERLRALIQRSCCLTYVNRGAPPYDTFLEYDTSLEHFSTTLEYCTSSVHNS